MSCFGLKMGGRICHFGLKLGMVFKRTTDFINIFISFNFKQETERKKAESKKAGVQ